MRLSQDLKSIHSKLAGPKFLFECHVLTKVFSI